MTLGPAFGAPPPSEFNEPHDTHHHEPAPVDPDEEREKAASNAAEGSPPTSTPASGEPADKGSGKRSWFGWLRRSG